ncbi:MAG: ATP synthase F1 subunit delta [Oscillospiraceae bacterium]|nr:ATP synthase F1 subunit delta [Oscillospiraceae bacterium]
MTADLSYAQALFDAASERGMLAVAARELEALTVVIKRHIRFFLNPGLPAARRALVLRECLEGKAHPLIVTFFSLLIERGHIKWLDKIVGHMTAMYRASQGEATVRLRVPYAPDGELLEKLRDALGKTSLCAAKDKGHIHFDVEIDEGLLGGFTAECGGRVWDASLRTRLRHVARIKNE